MLKGRIALCLFIAIVGSAVILSDCGKTCSVKPTSDVKLFK